MKGLIRAFITVIRSSCKGGSYAGYVSTIETKKGSTFVKPLSDRGSTRDRTADPSAFMRNALNQPLRVQLVVQSLSCFSIS